MRFHLLRDIHNQDVGVILFSLALLTIMDVTVRTLCNIPLVDTIPLQCFLQKGNSILCFFEGASRATSVESLLFAQLDLFCFVFCAGLKKIPFIEGASISSVGCFLKGSFSLARHFLCKSDVLWICHFDAILCPSLTSNLNVCRES